MSNKNSKTPVEVPVAAPAETVNETPVAAAEIVPDVPTSALTQQALTKVSAASMTLEQFEEGLAVLEGRISDLAVKYPEWADGLSEVLMRYGQQGSDEAFDVSVNAPGTYIRLRHGMSKNVPKELKVDVGEFFTAEKNLGSKFEAVILYAHDARKYFVGSDLGAPECQSHDGKFGSRYGECAKCPFEPYDEAAKKSQCSRAYSLMIATPDFSVIGEMTFMKTSLASGRQMIQRMKTTRDGSSAWTTEIGTVEVTSGKHTNAVPTGGLPLNRTTPEQREVIETLTKFFKLRALNFAAKSAKRRALRGELDSAGALGAGTGAGSDANSTEVPPL